MTTSMPSTSRNLDQESSGCSEKIYRLSIAWFYIISGVSLIDWILTFIPIEVGLPFSIITNQIIFLISTDNAFAPDVSPIIVSILGKVIPFLFCLLFFSFGYFGYQKRFWAVFIGTALYFFDGVTHLLLGASTAAIMNIPAFLGLLIGLITLVIQKISKPQTGIPDAGKPGSWVYKYLWGFIILNSLLFSCLLSYYFLTFLVSR